jgi:pyruvate,water dikinase
MLTTPTLDERPEPVIALLKQYVEVNGESPEDGIARQAAERRAATSAVVRTLVTRAPAHAVLTWFLLRSTRIAVACRERARLKQALLYTRCRRVALRIGDELVRYGRLAEAADVFMLTWQEIDELCAGRAMFPRGVAALVETRRTEHAMESRLTPPDTFSLAEGAAFTAATARCTTTGSQDGRDEGLHGTTACGGCVSGPAAILAGVHEANRLHRGDVLVTRQTDPGWAPVFCLVSGLVIERGGMLSHGAIIAREFGLPCVVGVKEATSRIPHGAWLTVNADLGTCSVEAAR